MRWWKMLPKTRRKDSPTRLMSRRVRFVWSSWPSRRQSSTMVRLGARVAVLLLPDLPRRRTALLPRPVVEVLDQPGPMVLLDGVADRLRQVVLAGELDALLDVVDEDEGAHRGEELVVAVLPRALVLDEVLRAEDLADVVVEPAGVSENGVGADPLATLLGEVRHHQGVLEGARRLEGEPAQERQVGVRQL